LAISPVVTGHGELPDWLARRVDETVSELLASRRAELPTSRFTAGFELTSPRPGRWQLHYNCDDPSQASGGGTLPTDDLTAYLRHEVIMTIIGVIEG